MSGGGAAAAGGALERALQQLAALGGESMSNRINVRVVRYYSTKIEDSRT